VTIAPNHDDSVLVRVELSAARLTQALAGLPDPVLFSHLSKLGLGGERGPHRLPLEPPPPAARGLAEAFAEQSIPPLAEALSGRDRISFGPLGNGHRLWKGHRPIKPLNHGASSAGLPLLGACSDVALAAAFCELCATHMHRAAQADREGKDPFVQIRANLRAALTDYLLIEASLWDLALPRGGPTAFIPYAFRFAAIEWWWSPDAHRGRTAISLCLRCGAIWVPRRRPRSDVPLCAACRRHGLKELQAWPPHAIAPAERGTWWLRCATEGCITLFLSHAQARRCPDCRSAQITKSRRRPAGA
jgi:hypothetical protein